MKDTWDVLKKVGIALAIIIPSVGWIVTATTYRNIVTQLQKNDEKQDERWEIQEERWSNQDVINGKSSILYDYFIGRITGPAEEESP